MSKLAHVRPAFAGDNLPETPPNVYRPADSLPMRRCVISTYGTPFPLTRANRRVCNDTCRSNLRHFRPAATAKLDV